MSRITHLICLSLEAATDYSFSSGNFTCCLDGVKLCLCGTGSLTRLLSILNMILLWVSNSGGVVLSGKTEKLGEKLVQAWFYPPQSPHWRNWKGSHGERSATNRLSFSTYSAWDLTLSLFNVIMNVLIPWKAVNFLTNTVSTSFSRSTVLQEDILLAWSRL
jgi:hypothetical protein